MREKFPTVGGKGKKMLQGYVAILVRAAGQVRA